MTRPLERLGIDALEAYFGRSMITEDDLLNLKEELEIRTTMRAKGLLQKVVKKLAQLRVQEASPDMMLSDKPLPAKALRKDSVEAAIFASTQTSSKEIRTLSKGEPAVVEKTNSLEVTQVAPTVALTQEQALKVLRLPATASWEQIENSRRELVARAQPDRLIDLSIEKRKVLQDECRQVNAAYRALMQSKA